jgi:hypothetical protein
VTPDIIDTLAALDPVRTPPSVESVERVLAAIHEERRPSGRRTCRTRARGRGIAAGAAVLIVACAVGLVLAGGSSGPGVDVAAGAYQATSPGAGVLEADFVDHLFERGRLVAVVSRREWIDASQGSRRAQRITRPAGHGCASLMLERASAPGEVELASGSNACPRPDSGRGSIPEPEDVQRIDLGRPRPQEAGGTASESSRALTPSTRPRVTLPPEIVLGAGRDTCSCFSLSQAFQGDASPLETEGLSLYRRLYREGVIRLVGRVRLGGRLLWKLEGVVAWASSNLRAGRFRPTNGLVVLVDPTDLHPVVEQQVNLSLPGHPVTVESQLVGYRRLPRNATSQALLQISAQRPGLRVITRRPHILSRRPYPRTVFRDR